MSTLTPVPTPDPSFASWRHRAAAITPGLAAVVVYCLAAVVMGAWWAVPLAIVAYGIGRHYATRRHQGPRSHIGAAIFGGAVVIRDGLRGTILLGLLATGVVILVMDALISADNGHPIELAVLAAIVTALTRWARHHTDTETNTGPAGPGGRAVIVPISPTDAPWRPLIAEGHFDPSDGPTEHYRRQIRRANHLREEEAAVVYAQGRADGASAHHGRRAGRQEGEWGSAFTAGWDAGREAWRDDAWADRADR